MTTPRSATNGHAPTVAGVSPALPAEIVATYDYRDECGELLFQVVRRADKSFVQRRPDGRGGWTWGLGETRRVVYRLPELMEHVGSGSREPIYIAEGEKDVEAIAAAGAVATCNPMGALKWSDDYSESFMGARSVVIVADRDEAGRAHARAVRDSLARVAGVAREEIAVREAAEGKDAADHLAAGRKLADLVPVALDDDEDGEALRLRVVTLDEFADVDEPGAAALVGTSDEALIPEGGDVMFYGDGGAGKTTLCVDLACHLAAGDAWLGVPVARPARVLLIENEGPRALFRAKLRRKRDGWRGSSFADRVQVLENPWGRVTFAEEASREKLAEEIRARDVDVVVIGPVTRSGMNEAGTLQEVREFMALIASVREASCRLVTFVLVHHENKGGKVSGAWEGSGDTLFHVQGQGHARVRLYVQKARWSSAHHATTFQLVWADGDGFAIEDKPELDDDALAEQISAAIRANPGLTWTEVTKATPGAGTDRRNAVRDSLLRRGEIVNLGRAEKGGEKLALAYCPERFPASLYLADDPLIRHLLPARGAGREQIAPASGAGPNLHLLPAPRPIEGAGVGADDPPPDDPDEETVERLADIGREIEAERGDET
jgi:AAA domain